MTVSREQAAEEVASAARAFARLGYVHAFGHVSRRLGSAVLITPTRPGMARLRGADVLELDLAGDPPRGTCPIEAPLHLAIYAARPDVAAICRTHAPHASSWAPARPMPPVLHGFGGIVAAIGRFDDPDLVHDRTRGGQAAASLGAGDALMLSGNGVLTVGSSLAEAAARMWSLEERCREALRQGAEGRPLDAAALQARGRWYPAEVERVWLWLRDLASSPDVAAVETR